MSDAVRSRRTEEIVEAARELLDEGGIEAVTMRNVADRLGIRAPSLYKHLPDKHALETALVSDGFAEMAAAWDAALAAGGEPLETLARAYRDFGRRKPHLYRLMTARELDRAGLEPGVEEAAARPLVEALGHDPDLARAAFGFVHGMTILELDKRFPPDVDLDGAWKRGLDALRRASTRE